MFHRHGVCHSLTERAKADRHFERWLVLLLVEKVRGVVHSVAVMRYFSRAYTRAYYKVFWSYEFLACLVLCTLCFLPYRGLIGFKIGGVNEEKG